MTEFRGRRTRDREDEQGESYYVSMSDLMAGVLFLFIIMLTNYALLLRSAPPQRTNHQRPAAAAPEALKLAPPPPKVLRPANTGPAAPPISDARTAALNAIADELKARGITVVVDTPAGALHFSNDLLFAGSAAALSGQGRTTAAALAAALETVLPCFTADSAQRSPACPHATGRIGAVFIEGHSDTGTAADWLQSAGQGSAAFQGLLQARPNLQAMQTSGGQSLFSVAGYGPSRPVQPGATSPDQRRTNSRLDVRLVLAS